MILRRVLSPVSHSGFGKILKKLNGVSDSGKIVLEGSLLFFYYEC